MNSITLACIWSTYDWWKKHVFLYLIFLSQQVLYFLLSTLVLTLYIDVVLSLSICRMECISAAAKWLPSRQMRPIKRSGDPDDPNYRCDWRIEKFSCPSHCPNFWFSKYTVSVSTFLCQTAQNYFSLAAALVHAWCDVSVRHKLAIAIVTLVFPEPGDCWGMRDSKAASVDRSVTGPTTVTTNLEFPIRLLPSAFIFC